MFVFKSIFQKEILLLMRDRMGLIFLLLMPLVLVFLMTSLQNSTFKALEKQHIDLVILNQDKDILGDALVHALDSAGIFNIVNIDNVTESSIVKVQEKVRLGIYEIGILIPKKATKAIRKHISNQIKKQMFQSVPSNKKGISSAEIKIFFNPVIKGTFKQIVSSSVREIIANIQIQMLFKSYTKTIERLTGKPNKDPFVLNIIDLSESSTAKFENQKMPNSTEHNVPAWTVFAIFFIVIPLSGQIITEKRQGISKRLSTFPVPMFYHYIAKMAVYSLMSIIQLSLLMLVGYFVLPLINLPQFPIEYFFKMIVFTFFIGLSATSFAIAVGIITRTQHQAAIFGSIMVVVLSAIGGVWVPVYIMSDAMQVVAKVSPLYWSLDGYHKIILQHSQWRQVLPNILLLLTFSVSVLAIAVKVSKKQP